VAKLKEKISDQVILAEVVDSVLDLSLKDFIDKTDSARQRFFLSRNRLLMITITFLVLFVALISNLGHQWFKFGLIILVAFGVYIVYQSYRLHVNFRDFVFVFTFETKPIIEQILGYQVRHQWANVQSREIDNLLMNSGLFNEDYNKVQTDDVYYLDGERSVMVAEIKLEKEEQRGKNLYSMSLFHGSLVRVTLPRLVQTEIYLSTSGDKRGFVHNKFWHRLLGFSNIKEVSLEWNQFEKDLHVASSSQVEARTVLTPDFMIDLHTWWLESRDNIRMVFRGEELIMLLPDNAVSFGAVPTAISKGRIKEYLFSVTKPLWRTIILAEDLR